MRKILFLLSALILFGCASSTVIKTIPEGAKVKKNGQLMGITPYDHWDREVSGYTNKFTLQMDGYKDKEITIEKDVFYFHRLILPPVLAWPWLYGYNPGYYFELEKNEKSK
jgi:hypothetical protein